MSEAIPTGEDVKRALTPRLCAAASIAIGSATMIGWAFGLETLKCVIPGLANMKPNSALVFILAGVALSNIRVGRENKVASYLACSVAAIGALTLFEYTSGVDLGIDQLLFREPPGAIESLWPGRMHPVTAMNFAAIGTAIALVAGDHRYRTAHFLAMLAALTAGSALVGNLYGVRRFEGMAAFNQMALHTAIGTLTLAVCVISARPGREMAANAGDQTARRLLPVAILLPVALEVLSLMAGRSGLLDPGFAAAARVVATIAILATCIGANSHALNGAGRDRLLVEGRYRFLTETMPLIIWTARPDGGADYMNRRWTEFTGQGREQYEGRGWERALHSDDVDRCRGSWERSTGDGTDYQCEFRLRNVDGSFRWHLCRAEPMRGEDGEVLQWVGTCTDIHDRRLADEQRYRSLVEATSAIVWITPASGEFESDQQGWTAFTGQSFGQLRGWGWLDAVHPEDRDETARVWAEATASRLLYQVEHRLRRCD
jgi:PAS domain S-box-containing protein